METALFTRIVGDYLDDDEYRALQKALVANPEAGTVIRGSGGVRKIRWDAESRGKRGGVRVICFRRAQPALIWLLTIYAKNEAETISAAVLRKIKQKIEND